MSSSLPKRKALLGIFFLLVISGMLVYFFKFEAVLWHVFQPHEASSHNTAAPFALHHYKVELEGVRILDVGEDISGLTYNEATNTLFTVSNSEPWLIELSLDGRVLRKVWIDGVKDMEGISHVKDNLYIVVNERDQKLILVNLEDGVDRFDARHAPQLTLSIDAAGNKGFEGASWDSRNNRLLIVKERNPKRVLAIHGLINSPTGNAMNLHVENLNHIQPAMKQMRDLSSISYHDASGHMFLLSDESRMITELDSSGKLVGTLALWRGFHGLKRNVPQAEGIAIGPDKRIYIVSEPNLFYVFKPDLI